MSPTDGVEEQLRRVNALSHFALGVPSATSETDILGAALEMIGGVISLTGAVALIHAEAGLHVVAVRTHEGELIVMEPDDPDLLAAIAETSVVREVQILEPPAEVPLSRWLERNHPGLGRSLVVFRLAPGLGGAPGVLVLRSATGVTEEGEGPFLELALAHLNAALTSARARYDLERRVELRTRELGAANLQLQARLKELRAAQAQIVEVSRKAGMAEVAIDVLHNVGNGLTSINASAQLLMERARTSRSTGLERAVAQLRAQPDLPRFFAEDSRAATLIEYLGAVSAALAEERERTLKELDALSENIEQIKIVVGKQQTLASAGGVLQSLSLSEVVEEAIRLSVGDDSVALERDFGALSEVKTDRDKLLQIVLSLLSNARRAVPPESGRIRVRTRLVDAERVSIEVEDNGVGIAPENLGRIFGQNLATRDGLHNSACAAAELGGHLSGHSDGVDQGARFTLVLPRVLPRP